MTPIVHFDADAFFASCEQAVEPKLRGIAMAVGGGRRGIIAAASYEARARGVYTPMPTRKALQVCPELVVVRGQFRLYEEISKRIFALCDNLTPVVEKGSIDEGFLDLTGAPASRDPEVAIRALSEEIRETMGITLSFGIATNKLVAAVASKLNKPAGFTVVPAGEEAAFLAPLDIGKLPGVGPKTQQPIRAAGVNTIGELAALGPDRLHTFFGSSAEKLHRRARGIDDRPVVIEREDAKSYGHQETFDRDHADGAFLERQLKVLLDDLTRKLRRDGKMARTITVKIRYKDMREASRSRSLDEPTDLESDFYPLLGPLLKDAWARHTRIRLVSVRLSNIYESRIQPDLFDGRRDRLRDLAKATDALNAAMGTGAIKRGVHLFDEE